MLSSEFSGATGFPKGTVLMQMKPAKNCRLENRDICCFIPPGQFPLLTLYDIFIIG